MTILKLTRYMHATDVLIIGYAGALSLINLIFASRIPSRLYRLESSLQIRGKLSINGMTFLTP